MFKVKEKESHKSQTKVDNLEDTLAKNKIEKTELVREVYNLKNSVKSLEKKARKNNERSELAQKQNKVPTKAPKISITIAGKESRNLEEALETDANHNSSSAAANANVEENQKNLYKITTTTNPFEILSDSDDISTSSMANPTIGINPDL